MQTVTAETELSLDLSHIVTEDNTPVDNLFSSELQRLLVETLYSSWARAIAPRPFLADANVGIFYALRQPPLVPDVFLSLDVQAERNFHQKRNRSYFVWEFGKPPDVVIEIVSNQEGNELSSKLKGYANIGVNYYAVFDPLQQLGDELLQVFGLHEGHYVRLSEINGESERSHVWLAQVGLGLRLWEGIYEGKRDHWLRWCDANGEVILTGAEWAEQEYLRAERLASRLQEMGIDPAL